MTPWEVTDEQTRAKASPFTSRALTLYGQRNWVAVVFFASLGIVHGCIAFRAGIVPNSPLGWEFIFSTSLAVLFVALGALCCFARTELTIAPLQQSIRIRRGVGRFRSVREVPFDSVRAVRLTLGSSMETSCSRIEIVCRTELIECPPTPIPRQEALYLALVFGVRLIKVYGCEWDPQSHHPSHYNSHPQNYPRNHPQNHPRNHRADRY